MTAHVAPLRFRRLGDDLLFSDEAGGYFLGDEAFLERHARGRPSAGDLRFLSANGQTWAREGDLAWLGFAARWSRRLNRPRQLGYVILVPTLRCNLNCSYCQVSRADERAKGHDWTPETLARILTFLDGLETTEIKVEFQGGEPLLRLDLIEAVRDFCRARFQHAEFVVCTNLQRMGPAEWTFLDAPDTCISTSLDGPAAVHGRQRTAGETGARQFRANLAEALRRFGPERVSALPTIDMSAPPSPREILDSFAEFGLRSIFLRPVNHQGFARKKHDALAVSARWNAYYGAFIDLLIEENAKGGEIVEEFYFSQALRRVLRPGEDGHVDLRNPNLLGEDYLLIDFDGRFYPTDEARMVTRVGRIDLSVGDLERGLDRDKLKTLNVHASSLGDPDCIHCPYQAFCGVDLIDDLSRYGRIDMPRAETEHCRRHLFLFDKIFSLLYSQEPKAQRSLAAWSGVEALPLALAPVHA